VGFLHSHRAIVILPVVQSWNDWFHCTAHTYGTWLRGDPRGWRARHHREHVDGDYKQPPPKGKYKALYEYSKSLMKRDPVELERELRQFVLDAIVARLNEFQIPTAAACLDKIHLHVLMQCKEHNPRIILGIAKQYATAQLKAHGFAEILNLQRGEGLWSRRSHPEPITSERHFQKSHDYIRDHGAKGAVVFTTSIASSMESFDPTCLLLD
jgi:hypothetical protein